MARPDHSLRNFSKRSGHIIIIVEIPWHVNPKTGRENKTKMAAMERDDPDLRQLVGEAQQIERAWASEELAASQAVERVAAQRRADAQKVLQ